MSTIAGARILLTGASSGIGRALAERLAAKGARLALVARREERLNQLAQAVEGAGHARPLLLVGDLSQPGTAADLARQAREGLGELDVVVNNAGSSVQGLGWVVGDREEARDVFETNFWSPMALLGEVVPEMSRRRSGHIVNVTSLVQVSPYPGLSHYCGSKSALALATETLRLELRSSGVKVLEVALGPVDTPASAESRLLPGGEEWLEGTRLGSAAGAAAAIAKAIEGGAERLIYPRSLKIAYTLPGLGRRYAKRMARFVDPDDTTVRRTGWGGDSELEKLRVSWEEAHAQPAGAGAGSGSAPQGA